MSERTYKKETVVEGPNGVVQSAKWFSGVRYRGRWNELPERRVVEHELIWKNGHCRWNQVEGGSY